MKRLSTLRIERDVLLNHLPGKHAWGEWAGKLPQHRGGQDHKSLVRQPGIAFVEIRIPKRRVAVLASVRLKMLRILVACLSCLVVSIFGYVFCLKWGYNRGNLLHHQRQ